jgi:predicted AlkP superfamily phosphohydrolase/phosphomutase
VSQMAPRLLFVGFEAMDRDVAQELVAAGRMPNLARLQRDGLTAAMANPVGMLTGPVWASLVTGVHPDRHNRLNWRVLRSGTYRMEYLGPFSALPVPPMWRTLAAHDVSSLVLDVPTIGLEDDPLVTHVIDWHIHDRDGTPISSPPEVAADVGERYQDIAPDHCDDEGAAGELRRLRATILGEVETFADGVVWLMDRTAPDVVVACSGASHCAGHQFWHLHDPGSVRRGTDDRAELGDVMAEVYEALDAALGRVLDALPADCTVAVVLSHGMGDNAVMPHLIDPIARAIDDAMGPAGRWHWTREFARRVPNRAARKWYRWRGRSVQSLAHIADGSRRFFPIENFPTHGAMRCNVIGREPNGRVRREDLPSLLDRLEAELLAVCDADTGEPVARRVIRTADHYDHVDTSSMADLLVEWMGTKVVETVTSPTIGTIHRPFRETRTGAHRQDGLVVLHGPGIEPGSTSMRSVDVWPTLASILGVDPGDVDGHAIPEVAAARTG